MCPCSGADTVTVRRLGEGKESEWGRQRSGESVRIWVVKDLYREIFLCH